MDALNVVNIAVRSSITPATMGRDKGTYVDERFSGGVLLTHDEMLTSLEKKKAAKVNKQQAKLKRAEERCPASEDAGQQICDNKSAIAILQTARLLTISGLTSMIKFINPHRVELRMMANEMRGNGCYRALWIKSHQESQLSGNPTRNAQHQDIAKADAAAMCSHTTAMVESYCELLEWDVAQLLDEEEKPVLGKTTIPYTGYPNPEEIALDSKAPCKRLLAPYRKCARTQYSKTTSMSMHPVLLGARVQYVSDRSPVELRQYTADNGVGTTPGVTRNTFWIVTHLVLLDLHSLPLACFVRLPCRGKRKTRESEDPFINTTKALTDCNKALDKLRKDLWLTTVKQQKLVQLIRNEIPDFNDSDAKKLVHDITELLKRRIQQIQGLLERSLDHSIQLFEKHRLCASVNVQADSTAQVTSTLSASAGQDTLFRQQLLLYVTQQQQQYQAQIYAQMPAQMQQANERFEFVVASRGDQKKKDPPVY
ncbi:unnamed protein product [Phytophthora fragariaefolia]|uniref:Unnamed protein product n=1 Tax=Phytophthora fragariaefolia TaxID=1490495 RepID=A0A9W7CPE8_9STRA|nr:unnamed protein product [Phytophthora fragariaefolia]